MSDAGEEEFIAGAKPDHLYTHHFYNGSGKFFNVVTLEDGNTAVEYEQPGSFRNRIKLTLTFIKDANEIRSVTLKKFKHYKNDGWQEQYWKPGEPMAFTHFSFEKLVTLLQLLSELDLASVNERRIALVEAKGMGIDQDTERKLKALLIQPDGQKIIEELVRSGLITSRDIVNIGYRKSQLDVFQRLLSGPSEVVAYAIQHGLRDDQPEKSWQYFFKQNEWIFGFGLDYRFLSVLQDEAHVGAADVVGRDGAISDFLMGSTNFTVLVEVKRPDTQLFSKTMNRANSWQLSRQLLDAVSQILEQKASWLIKSEVDANRNFDATGSLVTQKTVDPKCILIIGSEEMVTGTEKEIALKRRTFELFRRDSRNIEIVTFTELFERAVFIVEHSNRKDRS